MKALCGLTRDEIERDCVAADERRILNQARAEALFGQPIEHDIKQGAGASIRRDSLDHETGRVETYDHRGQQSVGRGVVFEPKLFDFADGEAPQSHRRVFLQPSDVPFKVEEIGHQAIAVAYDWAMIETGEIAGRSAASRNHNYRGTGDYRLQRVRIAEIRRRALEPELCICAQEFLASSSMLTLAFIWRPSFSSDKSSTFSTSRPEDCTDVSLAFILAAVSKRIVIAPPPVVIARRLSQVTIPSAAIGTAQIHPGHLLCWIKTAVRWSDRGCCGSLMASAAQRPTSGADRREWEASSVSTTTRIKGVAPAPPCWLTSEPKFISGTKTAMVKGSTFDQRPSSSIRRKSLVL